MLPRVTVTGHCRGLGIGWAPPASLPGAHGGGGAGAPGAHGDPALTPTSHEGLHLCFLHYYLLNGVRSRRKQGRCWGLNSAALRRLRLQSLGEPSHGACCPSPAPTRGLENNSRKALPGPWSGVGHGSREHQGTDSQQASARPPQKEQRGAQQGPPESGWGSRGDWTAEASLPAPLWLLRHNPAMGQGSLAGCWRGVI